MAAGPPWGSSFYLARALVVMILVTTVSAKLPRRLHLPSSPWNTHSKGSLLGRQGLLESQEESLRPETLEPTINRGQPGGKTSTFHHENIVREESSQPRDLSTVQRSSSQRRRPGAQNALYRGGDLANLPPIEPFLPNVNLSNLQGRHFSPADIRRFTGLNVTQNFIRTRVSKPKNQLEDKMDQRDTELARSHPQPVRGTEEPPPHFHQRRPSELPRRVGDLSPSLDPRTQGPASPYSISNPVPGSQDTDLFRQVTTQPTTSSNEFQREENSGPRKDGDRRPHPLHNPLPNGVIIGELCCVQLSKVFCNGPKMKPCRTCVDCTIEKFVEQTCPGLSSMAMANTSDPLPLIGYVDETRGSSCYRYFQDSDRQPKILRRTLEDFPECRTHVVRMCPNLGPSRPADNEARRRAIQLSARRAYKQYKLRRMLQRQRIYYQQSLAVPPTPHRGAEGWTRSSPLKPMMVDSSNARGR